MERFKFWFYSKRLIFGAVKLAKNAGQNKYSYSGYGIVFNSRSRFSVLNFDWCKNVVIFGVDNSASVQIDNKKKDILVLVKGPTQGFDDTAITVEAKYYINFSRPRRKFCLILHSNGSNSFFYFLIQQIHINSKQ